MTPRRRQVLHLSGIAAIGSIAGCISSGQSDSTPTPTETREPGIQLDRIHPDGGEGVSSFGFSAATSQDGSTAVVGSPGDDGPDGDKAGAAYVFEVGEGTWSQAAKLTPEEGTTEDWFGRAVALSDDGATALVGAENQISFGSDDRGMGSAYTFRADGGAWTHQATLVPSENSPSRFGNAVAVAGDGTVGVVGDLRYWNTDSGRRGAAYVYTV